MEGSIPKTGDSQLNDILKRLSTYKKTFKDVVIKVERYDYSIGQNQIIGIEKSTNNGKDYIKVTDEPITVSMEAKYIFLDENLGFIITKPDITKSNNYNGVKVTHDGGKTFIDGTINYTDPDIETITVKDVPYKEENVLKLPCSIYQTKKDKTGYEDKDITFYSTDKGLTWILTDSSKYIQFKK